MTISEIRNELNARLDVLAGTYGENDTLNTDNNVAVTDNLAEGLETVNPTHTYPPVLK